MKGDQFTSPMMQEYFDKEEGNNCLGTKKLLRLRGVVNIFFSSKFSGNKQKRDQEEHKPSSD